MPRSANGQKLAAQADAATRSPAEHRLIRVGRPANDNVPRWAARTGSAIVIGGVALAALVVAALLYA